MVEIPEPTDPLPSNVKIVNPDGTPSVYFLRQWLSQRVLNLSTEDLIAEINALNARVLTAGVGLNGGGDLSADRTFDLANTAVTAGTYGDANNVPQFTVDAQGRITSVANVLITGGGGSSENFLSDRLRQSATTKSGSANASKGLEFSPLVGFDVHRASGWFAPVASAQYTACIATIGSSGGTTITAAPSFSDTLVAHASDTTVRWNQFKFSTPVTVAAGSFYVLLISRVDGGDTYILPIGFAIANTLPDAAFDLPLIPDSRYVLLPKAVPANGQTLTRTAGSMPTVGMMIELT